MGCRYAGATLERRSLSFSSVQVLRTSAYNTSTVLNMQGQDRLSLVAVVPRCRILLSRVTAERHLRGHRPSIAWTARSAPRPMPDLLAAAFVFTDKRLPEDSLKISVAPSRCRHNRGIECRRTHPWRRKSTHVDHASAECSASAAPNLFFPGQQC